MYAHGWTSARLAPFTLTAGRQPKAPGEAVLDAGLAARAGLSTGDTTRIAVGAVPADYRVVGLVTAPALTRQSAVFVGDDVAAGLSDRLTAVGVLAESGVDADDLAGRITAAIGDVPLSTYTGADIGDVQLLDVGTARSFLTVLSSSLVGTITAMVVLFVVAVGGRGAVHRPVGARLLGDGRRGGGAGHGEAGGRQGDRGEQARPAIPQPVPLHPTLPSI